ncbi:hypothetical protein ACFMQL_30465 [Nonomuraea fastidiosa]|uniref:hypothetical protein n=1 Tax=Nonomuraea fastidiosa TaxID=46173 RepID=UPI00366EE202
MDGFIDETCEGVTELRVHGVSGTPPSGILAHPHPRLVAGDGTTGFYRRWWEGGPPSGDHADVPGVRHREAYAWGNLTSGGRAIALWLLLLPFSLANLAYFMLPRPARARRLRHVTEAGQRLFALLLTGTLIGAVTRTAVDVIGWQCTAAGRACAAETAPSWVRWLAVMWGDEPSRRLAVTSLVPLLVVVLLWWLARRTWRRDENTFPPGGPATPVPAGGPAAGVTPAGGVPAPRAQADDAPPPSAAPGGGGAAVPAARTTSAAATSARVKGAPGTGVSTGPGSGAAGTGVRGSGVASGPGVSAGRASAAAGVGARAGGVAAGAGERAGGGLLLGRPRLWHGGAPVWRLRVVHVAFAVASIGVAVAAPFAGTAVGLVLTVANAAVLVVAAVLVTLPCIARRVDPHSGRRTPVLLDVACRALRVAAPVVFLATAGAALAGLPPGDGGTLAWQLPGVGIGAFQYALTVGLGTFLLITTFVLVRADRRSPSEPGSPSDGEPRAMMGMAAWFVLMVAVGSANVLALGLLFWTAAFFGVPGTAAEPGPLERALLIDDSAWWTAALVPLLAFGLLALTGVLWLMRKAAAARLAPELKAYYDQRDDAERVAAAWALAALTDRAGLVLGVLTAVGAAGSAVVAVLHWLGPFTPGGGVAGMLASAGSWTMVAAVAALVLVARRTYRDSRLRRAIGVLWDICTFWPRAIHPLAPPCYTERVVPELVSRVRRLAATDRDQVVLSGHSQGSVIAAAVVLQLDPATRARVRLLTHGSPLRRLYAAYFPAYFGPAGLAAVREAVTWCNLYRLSDPIGGPAFRRVDPLAGGRPDGVDRFCWDPRRPGPGEPLPETRWHTAYWLDPLYDEALDSLITVTPAV